MKHSDAIQLAEVLSNFNQYRKGTVGQEKEGRGSNWSGVKLLKDVDHQRVADRLLRKNWHNRTAASAMMDMAQSVEHLLTLRLTWDQRKNLGRVLISSLTYSELYYLDRYPPDKNTAPYYIFQTDKVIEEKDGDAHRISPNPFSRWMEPYDSHGNQLLRPSHPCPTELESKPYMLPPELINGGRIVNFRNK